MSSARLWIGVTDADSMPPDILISLSNGMTSVAAAANWKAVTAGGELNAAESRTYFQIVEITGLTARSRLVAVANEARATLTTLPAALPRTGEPPFTVLLGSCYFGNNDRGLATLMGSLLREVQPDMKVLCGDQLYLDFPSLVFGVLFNAKGKARLFLSKYLRNWGEPNSYRSLLQESTTYFSSDDHEFWNNFPNAATIVAPTWTSGGRAEWKRVARPLFDDFQNDAPAGPPICRVFNVGSLSFMVADTRLDREEGSARFMQDSDLQRVEQWARGLTGPGVLVVGQPVFQDPQTGLFGGITKRFGDRNLPDYGQYPRLVQALLDAPHSVLVLTGDVHFPRVAQAIRPGQPGREIIEVIASPAALVAGSHASTKTTPARFPSKPIVPLPVPVATMDSSRHTGDNLVTMGFTEAPGKIDVELKYWYIGEPQINSPAITFSLT